MPISRGLIPLFVPVLSPLRLRIRRPVRCGLSSWTWAGLLWSWSRWSCLRLRCLLHILSFDFHIGHDLVSQVDLFGLFGRPLHSVRILVWMILEGLLPVRFFDLLKCSILPAPRISCGAADSLNVRILIRISCLLGNSDRESGKSYNVNKRLARACSVRRLAPYM